MVRFVRQASCLLLVLVTEPIFAQPTAQSPCRLPPNLNTGVSQSTVELLWRASATFRERCRQQGATGSGVLPVEANDVGNDKDL